MFSVGRYEYDISRMKLGQAATAVQFYFALEDDQGLRFSGMKVRLNALLRVGRDFAEPPPSICFGRRNQLSPF